MNRLCLCLMFLFPFTLLADDSSLECIGKDVKDFGKVIYPNEKDSKVTFKLKNKSKDTVDLLTYQTSCSCVEVSMDKTSLASGDVANIQVKILNASISGKATYSVVLKASDHKLYPFTVYTYVTRGIVVSPKVEKIAINKDEKRQASKVDFFLYLNEEEEFPVNIKLDKKQIKYTKKLISMNEKNKMSQYLISISSEDLNAGQKIVIETLNEGTLLHEYTLVSDE